MTKMKAKKYIAAQNLINYNGQNHMSKQKEAEQNGEKE